MAAMCQSQGIPTRVVTGYLATDFNNLTGQYLVRESNVTAVRYVILRCRSGDWGPVPRKEAIVTHIWPNLIGGNIAGARFLSTQKHA